MTTQHVDLNQSWKEIASTPCLVEVENDNGCVLLHFAGLKPAVDTKAKHKLNRVRGLSFTYGGNLKTWARSSDTAIEGIVVT